MAFPLSSPSSSLGCCIWSILAPGRQSGIQTVSRQPCFSDKPPQTEAETKADYSSMAMNASAWAWCSQMKPAVGSAFRSDSQRTNSVHTLMLCLSFFFVAQIDVSTRWCLHDQLQKWFSFNIGSSSIKRSDVFEDGDYPPTLCVLTFLWPNSLTNAIS